MRILHLTHQYLPEYVGGVELYTQSLASGLAADGHEVAVFYRCSRAGRGGVRRMDGAVQVWAAWDGAVTPTRRFLASFYAPSLLTVFAQVLTTFRPDLVHIQHLMGLPLGLARLIQQRAIPYVVTLHDYWWVCANAQLITNDRQEICAGPHAYVNCARCALARAGKPALWPGIPALAGGLGWRHARLRRIVQSAEAAIAPTNFVHDWYAARHMLPTNRQVISHGIEYPPAPEIAGHVGPLRFAYLGGISWQKGVHVIVAALAELNRKATAREEPPAAELWIAGDETFDPEYARYLRSLATPAVRFCGRLSRAAVWQFLAQVDVLLVPSLWYETFALVVREAFAAKVPVIVSGWGALAEAVRDGVDGLRVPPGDVAEWQAAMARLTDSPALRESLRGHIKAPLTLREHLTRIEEIYARVI